MYILLDLKPDYLHDTPTPTSAVPSDTERHGAALDEGSTERQPKYAVPSDTERHLDTAISELFHDSPEKRYKSVLYVGTNPLRPYFFTKFINLKYDITVLEGSDDNIQNLRNTYESNLFKIIPENVLDFRAGKFEINNKFDVCFYYYGPECIPCDPECSLEDTVLPVLKKLESITNYWVVLGMPWGRRPQGLLELKYERQFHDVTSQFLERFGYTTDTFGETGELFKRMIAWKQPDRADSS